MVRHLAPLAMLMSASVAMARGAGEAKDATPAAPAQAATAGPSQDRAAPKPVQRSEPGGRQRRAGRSQDRAAPKPVQRVKRRAERHSEKQTRVHRIGAVHVFGRAQRPQAFFEITRVEPSFEVGTSRYSERDARFSKSKKRVRRVTPAKR